MATSMDPWMDGMLVYRPAMKNTQQAAGIY